MSKKQLQVASITNELAGASGFFVSRSPVASSPSQPIPEKHPSSFLGISPTANPSLPSNERTVVPSNDIQAKPPDIRTNDRTEARKTGRYPAREKIRHSFDVFADQLISLRELAIEQEKMFGERVLMGDLVQQAIDMLITKERNQ